MLPLCELELKSRIFGLDAAVLIGAVWTDPFGALHARTAQRGWDPASRVARSGSRSRHYMHCHRHSTMDDGDGMEPLHCTCCTSRG